jgi:hypothetical protein
VSSFRGHGVRNGSNAASSEKLEGERMGSDGTGCTNQHSALYAQQTTVSRFTSREKRCFSVSTTHVIQTRDREDKRFKSLKDFEVCDVLEKELRVNRQD